MKLALALVAALASCADRAAVTPPKPPTASPDEGACERLCARERACGRKDDDCARTCRSDVARMKDGFVAAYVRCFLVDLDQRCATFDDKAREEAHLRCFDRAVATFPRDEQNQRDMAEAVCDRGLRCLGLDKVGRDACMQATLDPKEPEVQLGQRLVDALRRERVKDFRACVDGAPCAKPDTHDDAVDECYARTIGRSTG